jgi:hypothetical protein
VNLRPGCIKRCQVVVKVNIMSKDLIESALLADTMLTKLYTSEPKCMFMCNNVKLLDHTFFETYGV